MNVFSLSALGRRLTAIVVFVLVAMLTAVPMTALGATPPTIGPLIDMADDVQGGIANGKLFYAASDYDTGAPAKQICMIDLSTGLEAGCSSDLSAAYHIKSVAAINNQVYVLLVDLVEQYPGEWVETNTGSIRSVNQSTGEPETIRYSFSQALTYYVIPGSVGWARDGQLFVSAYRNADVAAGYLRFTESGGDLTLGGFYSDGTSFPYDVAAGATRVLTTGPDSIRMFSLDGTEVANIDPAPDQWFYIGPSYDPVGGYFYSLARGAASGPAFLRIDPATATATTLSFPSGVDQSPSASMVIGDALFILTGDALVRMDLATNDFSVEAFADGYTRGSAWGMFYDAASAVIWLHVQDPDGYYTFIGYNITDVGASSAPSSTTDANDGTTTLDVTSSITLTGLPATIDFGSGVPGNTKTAPTFYLDVLTNNATGYKVSFLASNLQTPSLPAAAIATIPVANMALDVTEVTAGTFIYTDRPAVAATYQEIARSSAPSVLADNSLVVPTQADNTDRFHASVSLLIPFVQSGAYTGTAAAEASTL